jgi:hypothetical protein
MTPPSSGPKNPEDVDVKEVDSAGLSLGLFFVPGDGDDKLF